MLAARRGLARIPGLRFWKLMGSGTGEGFTPVPNLSVYAVLAAWPDPTQAKQQVETAAPFQHFRAVACETWNLFLSPISVRGRWNGRSPFGTAFDSGRGPVVALTRASVRTNKAIRFWQRVPDISRRIGSDPNVIFKIGVGELPWLHQVTFSIWPDERAMAAFARRDGAHARAIQAVRAGDWFAEEMYARFRVIGESGTWGGLRLSDRLPA
jgi:spheroidene monooxygenase